MYICYAYTFTVRYMISYTILDRPWQSKGMDFMGPLLKLNNFDYLLVMID